MLKKTQSLSLTKIGRLILSEKRSNFIPTNIQRTKNVLLKKRQDVNTIAGSIWHYY